MLWHFKLWPIQQASPLFSGSNLHISTQNDKFNKNQISCTFFKQSDPREKCSVVPDIQASKKILIDKFRCFIYFCNSVILWKNTKNLINAIFARKSITFLFATQKIQKFIQIQMTQIILSVLKQFPNTISKCSQQVSLNQL